MFKSSTMEGITVSAKLHFDLAKLDLPLQKIFCHKSRKNGRPTQRPVFQISMLVCSIVFIMNHSSILEYHLLVHYSTIFKESGKYIQFTAVLLPIRVFPSWNIRVLTKKKDHNLFSSTTYLSTL